MILPAIGRHGGKFGADFPAWLHRHDFGSRRALNWCSNGGRRPSPRL
jgi:hypothetical protein